MSQTILWHDYETWGINPSVDFPVQFAAIRTDLDLNILENEAPINWMCSIPHDYLPHPQACLVTGITPQLSFKRGMSEPQFADKVYQQLSRKETCVAGYNSIRFDDEVSRNLLFRNMFPVYEREFKNNNSRWDIIDLVRAAYALRPQGINWAYYENGKPCFKLDELTVANNIKHENAHDALSDVVATIAIAKLIKQAQPKLYDFYYSLRSKHEVDKHLSAFQRTILVHVSGYINADQGCCTLIMPICRNPTNPNAVICVDLAKPVDMLINNSAQDIREVMLQKNAQTRAHNNKPKLFSIAINKCPFVAPKNTLSVENAQRLGIDVNVCEERFKLLSSQQSLANLCTEIFTPSQAKVKPQNIDECLYSIDFPTPADMQVMDKIRHAQAEQLVLYQGAFENESFNEVLFRYRGRNYPMTLDEHELSKWQQHLQMRFGQNGKKACLSLQEYFEQIEVLMIENANIPKKMQILESLFRFGKQITGD